MEKPATINVMTNRRERPTTDTDHEVEQIGIVDSGRQSAQQS